MAQFEPGGDKIDPGGTYRLAFPTDTHGCFADPYAWELALEIICGFKPDTIIWGSDAMDFGDISKHARHCRLPTIDEEIKDESVRRRALIAAAPGASLWWLQDNHTTERYDKYIWENIPQMAEVEALQFHHLIDFPESRIISEYCAGETLRVIHGSYIRKHPGWSVLAELGAPSNRRGRIVRSVMMGHCHRLAHISLDNGIEGLECGTLQNLSPIYMRNMRRATNWSHGMGLARFGTDWSEIIPARFYLRGDYLRCGVEGREYKVKVGPTYSGY